MKKVSYTILPILAVLIGGSIILSSRASTIEEVYSEPEFEEAEQSQQLFISRMELKFPGIESWERPAGSLKVALQAGHWKNAELPDELERLRGTSLGTSGGGWKEADLNVAIAEKVKAILDNTDIVTEILPATVPPAYWADLFVAIHADGNPSASASGYKMAGPYRDYTGQKDILVGIFEEEYALTTGLPYDDNITRNMRGYYAFNWWRYDHSIHPMTPAIIVETGFMTNPNDRQIILNRQDLVAQGIANAIVSFLYTGGAVESPPQQSVEESS